VRYGELSMGLSSFGRSAVLLCRRYFADEIYCVYLEKMGRGVLGTWACSSAVECLRALYNISHIYI